MHFRRPLMSSPKSEPQWGRLYVQEIEATWAAMIVPETESPPEPGRLQGIALLRGHRRGGKAAGAQAPGRGRITALGGWSWPSREIRASWSRCRSWPSPMLPRSRHWWMELQAVIEAAREVPQNEGEVAAVQQVAELVGISEERAAKALSAIEAATDAVHHRPLRGIAEAWLKGHQETYRRRRQGR
jgi:hypothetical protein